MATASGFTITLHLHCHSLPGERFGEYTQARLGIQIKKDVVQDVSADQESVDFEIPVEVVRKEGGYDFKGPWVQGKPGERFGYLCWGERPNGQWQGIGRAKVALSTLDEGLVEEGLRTGKLRVDVECTDRAKGGPIYASYVNQQTRWSAG